jgi:hypothetical protein
MAEKIINLEQEDTEIDNLDEFEEDIDIHARALQTDADFAAAIEYDENRRAKIKKWVKRGLIAAGVAVAGIIAAVAISNHNKGDDETEDEDDFYIDEVAIEDNEEESTDESN